MTAGSLFLFPSVVGSARFSEYGLGRMNGAQSGVADSKRPAAAMIER